MNPKKQARPVAATTDLEKRHISQGRKLTPENYHSPRFPQGDCLRNCIPIKETLTVVCREIDLSFPEGGNNG